ncbi:MAG: hypothetical protein IPG01_02940 [Chitinophagaceae bacterium]|nr:hypothetical protein [Chitinophagaceae bacterium]
MKRYIKGWEKHHPKFQFIKWTEQNCPSDSLYLNTALKNRKWANASNFIRLYALRHQGGIYLDTDIEILKPFDPFMEYPCFLGFENRNAETDCINNAVVGAIKGHLFIDSCYKELLNNFDGLEMANLSSPVLTTKVLKSKSHVEYGKTFLKEWDLQLFPLETFYAFEYGEKVNRKRIGEDTFSIHHYMASWHPRDRKKWFRKLKSRAVQLRSQLLNLFK